MKLITYLDQNGEMIGAVQGDRVISLASIAPNMLALIEQGPAGLAEAQHLVDRGGDSRSLSSVTLMAPIPTPRRNIACLGLNYAEHAAEHHAVRGTELQLPEAPIIFTKATTAVNGPYGDILFDPAVSAQLDWEVELAFIIGPGGKNISEGKAMEHVYGYTVLNDVSARDLQRQGKQFFKGKSLDSSCPMGPWILTAGEVADPHALRISSSVNGVIKQNSSTEHLIFNIPAIIAYLSRGMSLLPGDIVATGTPSGVGFARQPPEFLKPGDVVECEIEAIGAIRNRVVTA